MATCEVCGNDKAFRVTVAGATHTFDSFECAIHALAPTCEHCGCPIIGHGVEADGRPFCCAQLCQAGRHSAGGRPRLSPITGFGWPPRPGPAAASGAIMQQAP